MQTAGNRLTKLSRKLQRKKGRQEENLFLVCGRKSIEEAVGNNAELFHVFVVENTDIQLPSNVVASIISKKELSELSPLEVLQDAMAICKIPTTTPLHVSKSALVCDAISDPGNLGTLIRLCDWFGIPQLVLGNNCVDAYNPKCIQASMGSIFRVEIKQMELKEFYSTYKGTLYAAYLDGEDLYSLNENNAPKALILGSESHGVLTPPEANTFTKVTIPRIGKAESLNVATAGAILLSHLRL